MSRASYIYPHLPLMGLALLVLLPCTTMAAVHQVHTYSNTATALGQRVTSSTLVWETYDSRDSKQLQFAVEGGKYITEDEHYPIYVCRVTIDGVPTSGHTVKIQQSYVCVASNSKHTQFSVFDVLVNKGHLGKISWKPWRKFNVGIPSGAIRIGDDAYIARHRTVPHKKEGEEQVVHWGADYNLGRLDPVGLGKIKVIENDLDKDYDEGDVLIETEPFRYELRDIKLDNIRLDLQENITDLASGVLANHGNTYSLVESVMTYEFDYMQYWGTHEGIARGLPTKIHEKDVSEPTEINWALRHNEKRSETKSVHTKLWPGTALNVTLKGNYVTLSAPYSAKLFAFYRDSADSVSRKISSDVKKNYLKDVKLDFSAVYWIENGTIVPTTTTTTSTTSTTTHATVTSTGEPTPMNEPPVVHLKTVGEQHSGPDSLEQSVNGDGNNNNNNEIPTNESQENFKHQKSLNAAGVGGSGSSSSSSNNSSSSSSHSSSAAVTCLSLLFVSLVVGSMDAAVRR